MITLDNYFDEQEGNVRALDDRAFLEAVEKERFGSLGNYFFLMFTLHGRKEPCRMAASKQWNSLSEKQQRACDGG